MEVKFIKVYPNLHFQGQSVSIVFFFDHNLLYCILTTFKVNNKRDSRIKSKKITTLENHHPNRSETTFIFIRNSWPSPSDPEQESCNRSLPNIQKFILLRPRYRTLGFIFSFYFQSIIKYQDHLDYFLNICLFFVNWRYFRLDLETVIENIAIVASFTGSYLETGFRRSQCHLSTN